MQCMCNTGKCARVMREIDCSSWKSNQSAVCNACGRVKWRMREVRSFRGFDFVPFWTRIVQKETIIIIHILKSAVM